MTCFVFRDYSIVSKKKLHRSLQVDFFKTEELGYMPGQTIAI